MAVQLSLQPGHSIYGQFNGQLRLYLLRCPGFDHVVPIIPLR